MDTPIQTQHFDVVVVGSGPAGSSTARTIIDEHPELSVLVVEAGPRITEPSGRHIKTLSDLSQRQAAQLASQGPDRLKAPGPQASAASQVDEPMSLVGRPGTFLLGSSAVQPGEDGMAAAAMSSNVGGMGAHWTCACPPPGDGERVDFIPAVDFDEALGKARELLCVTQEAFAGAPLSKVIADTLAADLNPGRPLDRQVQPMPLAVRIKADGTRYWTGPDVILGDLAEGPTDRFELRASTAALRIVHQDGAAKAVELLDVETGRRYAVGATAVVVAADALRSPQLLHASGIRPKALGHYLNDQPEVVAGVRLRSSIVPDEVKNRAKDRQRTSIDPVGGVNWVPFDQQSYPFHGQVMQMDASPVQLVPSDELWSDSIVGLGWFACKDLQFDDRVEFSDIEVDHLGLPAIRIHYNLTSKDHATIAAMSAEVRRLAELLGEMIDEAPIVLPNGSSLHYQGTVRMGATDDGKSVCDTDGQVWGTKNIYVAGNGVIPTPTACNPTLTAAALAVRTARRICQRADKGSLVRTNNAD
ncbi:GMC oxidoreductase [Paenarthrobacter sp. TYUT067]|uniref:GMC oxidoreductase n=1 Tax=Paenarthrobacter sp. TYUT067 TaxID=2926245 RepID=UPI00202E9682|nr:GMC oxidoreductase [Paenarthrobacter sp. TYUT067]MCM0616830.1 GMC oxidoreductase [Paenarthrobacter sp. TYUT067]